jgi:hypothetical protein
MSEKLVHTCDACGYCDDGKGEMSWFEIVRWISTKEKSKNVEPSVSNEIGHLCTQCILDFRRAIDEWKSHRKTELESKEVLPKRPPVDPPKRKTEQFA